jgi:hypothetical protein
VLGTKNTQYPIPIPNLDFFCPSLNTPAHCYASTLLLDWITIRVVSLLPRHQRKILWKSPNEILYTNQQGLVLDHQYFCNVLELYCIAIVLLRKKNRQYVLLLKNGIAIHIVFNMVLQYIGNVIAILYIIL